MKALELAAFFIQIKRIVIHSSLRRIKKGFLQGNNNSVGIGRFASSKSKNTGIKMQ
ncbi:Hypothetical protein PMT_2543 [Prochlorococcus marinus str. MIT 9313]|uniref:Uncharacterized protein n=1 Tax=Prochlorococcus marinus (strain MIT 9313) TaxID=74547 RepID=B9ERM0_PROMM|nr:Hypothetical protein PMT_2543 [Prochlorococcus marinus str. MIT 9313]